MRLGLITRCRNEPYVKEFVNHYLNEGVDDIYIIDDNSREGQYEDVSSCTKVHIAKVFGRNDRNKFPNILYAEIKNKFDWIIIVDMDEYITAKKNIHNTLRQELLTTFKDADCVKVPWVMMAFNGIKQNPDCLLETNNYRWDHNKKHNISDKRKLRCRYYEIEVKSIFKTKSFDGCKVHFPARASKKNTKVVDSVYNKIAKLDPYYVKLREKDISQAFLICFHYRTVSEEHCVDKLNGNKLKNYEEVDPKDLISFDFPEIIDNTLSLKSKQRPNIIG